MRAAFCWDRMRGGSALALSRALTGRPVSKVPRRGGVEAARFIEFRSRTQYGRRARQAQAA